MWRQTQLLAANQALNQELEKQSKFKDQFLSTMSHELRTSTEHSVGLFRAVCRRTLRPAKRSSALLHPPHPHRRKTSALISDILDLSKIEARLGWFAHDRKSGGRGGRAQCNYQKIPRVTAPVVWPAPRLRRRPLWRVGQPPAERAVPVGFLGDLGPCCARLRHLR